MCISISYNFIPSGLNSQPNFSLGEFRNFLQYFEQCVLVGINDEAGMVNNPAPVKFSIIHPAAMGAIRLITFLIIKKAGQAFLTLILLLN